MEALNVPLRSPGSFHLLSPLRLSWESRKRGHMSSHRLPPGVFHSLPAALPCLVLPSPSHICPSANMVFIRRKSGLSSAKHSVGKVQTPRQGSPGPPGLVPDSVSCLVSLSLLPKSLLYPHQTARPSCSILVRSASGDLLHLTASGGKGLVLSRHP